MKTINWPLWIGLATLLVLLGAIGYFVTMRASVVGGSRLVCDATIVRERGQQEWDKLMGPAKALPPVDMRMFDSMTSSTTTSTLEIKYSPSITNPLTRNEVLYNLASPENATNLSSPSLAHLLSIGIEPAESFTMTEEEKRSNKNLLHFRPDGTAMTDEEFARITGKDNNFSSFWSQGQSHKRQIQLIFQLDESLQARMLDCQVWDHDSRTRLSGGWSMSHGKNGLVDMRPNGSYWRDSKIDLVLDVAYGDSIVRSLEPREGATVDFGIAQGRVMSLLEDTDSNGYGSSSGARGEEGINIHLREKEGSTLMLLGMSPPCLISLLEGTVYYKEEGKSDNLSINRLNAFGMMSLRKPAGEIDHIELRLRTHIERKVIALDHIPGMPSENAGKTNLLEIVVPAVNFKREYEIENFLTSMLMLPSRQTTGFAYGTAKWSFPITMKNPSVRDVLEEYIAAYPGAECVINEKEGKLLIRKPLTPGEKIQKAFENIVRAFTGRP